jgi:S1-C subfamily serine protease
VTRSWLRIQIQSVLPEIADGLGLAEPAGILIAEVSPDGPAAKAGIAVGDLVDSVSGDGIKNAHDFTGVRTKGREEWIAVTVGRPPVQPGIKPPPTPKYEIVTKTAHSSD